MEPNKPVQQIVTNQNTPEDQINNSPASNQNGFIPLMLGVVMLLIVIAGGAYYLGTQKSKQDSSNNNTGTTSTNPAMQTAPTNTPTSTTNELTQQSQNNTVEKDGVKMTITPSRGSVGAVVNVVLIGIPTNTNLPFASIGFKDSTGAFGEDSTTTDYKVDTRKLGPGGSYSVIYKIPANVLIAASPEAQNPSKLVPTSMGKGYVVFSYNDLAAYQKQQPSDKTIEIPFYVTQ